jgi:hypothetical protein
MDRAVGRYGTFFLYLLLILTAIDPPYSIMGACILILSFIMLLSHLSFGVHKAVHPLTYSHRLPRVRLRQ